MHFVRSIALKQGLWLLYEEWGQLKDCHRILLWFGETESYIRVSPQFAAHLREASHG